jgi:hypothetical protein
VVKKPPAGKKPPTVKKPPVPLAKPPLLKKCDPFDSRVRCS